MPLRLVGIVFAQRTVSFGLSAARCSHFNVWLLRYLGRLESMLAKQKWFLPRRQVISTAIFRVIPNPAALYLFYPFANTRNGPNLFKSKSRCVHVHWTKCSEDRWICLSTGQIGVRELEDEKALCVGEQK